MSLRVPGWLPGCSTLPDSGFRARALPIAVLYLGLVGCSQSALNALTCLSVADYESTRGKDLEAHTKHEVELWAVIMSDQEKSIEALQTKITPNTEGIVAVTDRLQRAEEQTTALEGEIKEIKAALARLEGVHGWIDKLMTPLIGDLVDIGPDSRIRVIETYLEKLKEDVGRSSGEP